MYRGRRSGIAFSSFLEASTFLCSSKVRATMDTATAEGKGDRISWECHSRGFVSAGTAAYVFFGFVGGAVIILQRKYPNTPRPYKASKGTAVSARCCVYRVQRRIVVMCCWRRRISTRSHPLCSSSFRLTSLPTRSSHRLFPRSLVSNWHSPMPRRQKKA